MSDILNYFKEKNVVIGIIINIVVTFIAYILTFQYYNITFFYYDLQFLLGSLIGILFALKYRDPNFSITKYALITGISGGVFSALFLALGDTLLITGGIYIDIYLALFGIYSISGIVIGVFIGAIISAYFMYRGIKRETENEEESDNHIFKDLVEDK